jgi:hypothetical protein
VLALEPGVQVAIFALGTLDNSACLVDEIGYVN